MIACEKFQTYMYGKQMVGHFPVRKLSTRRGRELETGILILWTTDRSEFSAQANVTNCNFTLLTTLGQFLDIPLGLFGDSLGKEKHGRLRILRFKERGWKDAMGYMEAEFQSEDEGRGVFQAAGHFSY
jgi:hypothetical protein